MQRLTRRGWIGFIVLLFVGLGGVVGAQTRTQAAATGAPAMAAVAPSGAKIFPLAEVRRGLRGVAYTVFEGVTPEPMEVEILGVLTDAIGPGRDMILGRLKGEKPEYTGVVAGMSGSPVYVDGRLVGALSYRIGQFSKEPICGITPIEQMLEVRDLQAGKADSSASLRNDRQGLLRDRSFKSGQRQGPTKETLSFAQKDDVGKSADLARNDGSVWSDQSRIGGGSLGGARAVAGGGEVQPIETALVFGGFSQEAVALFGDKLRALGMTPVAGLGGAAAAGTKQPEPLVPGSAVSAVLVRGDLSISGTCTVTYVDPTRLLACGHPITQFGPVSMPMTKAEVLATLASPLNAFKIINTTETVGSFTEDRASAILGRFGVEARMIPVMVDVVHEDPTHRDETAMNGTPRLRQVRVDHEDPTHRDETAMNGAPGARQVRVVHEDPTHRDTTAMDGAPGARQVRGQVGSGLAMPEPAMRGGMHFEVLDNRELTPSAMLVSVYQSLSGTNGATAEMSYRMEGELTVKGQAPVKLHGIMSPTESSSGAIAAALYVNDRFSRVYDNVVEQPEVTGLRLRMEAIPERRTAVLEGARLGQTEAHAGETIEVEATLHPFQAETRVVRLKVKLPDSLMPGPLRIVVSDGATLDRLTMPTVASMTQHPVALADAVAQMNRMHSNDRIYVTLLDHSIQAGLDTQALAEVPLSMANVLGPLRAAQKMQLTGESVVEAGSMATGYAVQGTQVLTLDVR